MSSCHLQHHCRHHHRPPLGDVKNLQGTRPSTENYRQIRMLRLVESLPRGRARQLVSQCQVVSPENTPTATHEYTYLHIRIHFYLTSVDVYVHEDTCVCRYARTRCVCARGGLRTTFGVAPQLLPSLFLRHGLSLGRYAQVG